MTLLHTTSRLVEWYSLLGPPYLKRGGSRFPKLTERGGSKISVERGQKAERGVVLEKGVDRFSLNFIEI